MVVESEVLKAQNCALSKLSLPVHSNDFWVSVTVRDTVARFFWVPGVFALPSKLSNWMILGEPGHNIGCSRAFLGVSTVSDCLLDWFWVPKKGGLANVI